MALEPGWTPYCIDVAARRMLFVEFRPEADLSEAAFVYAMQAALARRALSCRFAALDGLASAVPAPPRLVFVFNMARCGSTLVHAMLNQVDGVWSLSEPDPFFDLAMRRGAARPGARLRGLIAACTRLMFRPPASRRAHTMAIKLRSQSLFQAEHFHAAFPDAAFVFLYREGSAGRGPSGTSCTISGRRPCWRARCCASTGGWRRRRAISSGCGPSSTRTGSVPMARALAPQWAMHVEEYLRLRAAGVPFLAVRYNELQIRARGGRGAAGAALRVARGQPRGDAGGVRPRLAGGHRDRARPARRAALHRGGGGGVPGGAGAARRRPRPGSPVAGQLRIGAAFARFGPSIATNAG